MSKICNQCNNKLDDNANFCTFCGGNNIREENVIENQSVQVAGAPVAQPVEQQPANNLTQAGIIEPQAVNKQTQNNIALENNEARQDFTTFEFPETDNKTQPITQPQETPQVPVVPSDFKLQSGADISQIPDANNPFDESLNAKNVNDAANKTSKKTAKVIIITILVTLGILIVLLAIFILFVSVSVDFKQEGPNCPEPAQVAPNQIRIGAEGYGFLTIPNSWNPISEVESGSSIQYGNGVWIISLNAANTANFPASYYASEIEKNLKQQSSTATVNIIQEKLINYTAYKIAAFYPEYQKHLIAWIFEAEDGNTHYIAVEGPTGNASEYSLPQTFGICK